MVAVAKRSTYARAREDAEFEAPTKEDPREARKAVAADQVTFFRIRQRELLDRIAKGTLLWREKGWEWEEPESDLLDEWPPLAKLFQLLDEYEQVSGRLVWLVNLKERPIACGECADVPEGFMQMTCLDRHTHWLTGARNRATAAGYLRRAE